MKLRLKNIGRISEATVEINGITVIAGENNTGKSTVGKVLYSVFNSFYDVGNQIKREKIQSVAQAVDSILFDNPSRISPSRLYSNAIAEYIIEESDYPDNKKSVTTSVVMNALKQYTERFGENIENFDISQKFIDRINEILSIEEEEIFKKILSIRFEEEFNGQLSNIYSEDAGEIHLMIKDAWVLIKTRDAEFLDIDAILELKTEAVYIDDPFVIDEVRSMHSAFKIRQPYDHRSHLKNKLLNDRRDSSIINEIITTNKFDGIFEKIGLNYESANFGSRQPILKTKKNNEEKPLKIKNLSTGIKTFLMIKTLLSNGTIESNGTMILDEPEIHLHPEWQILFAELIVLIQKEFGMHILLNTHSPYFLNAIEIFSTIHGISGKCKYYLSTNMDENSSVITDTTDNIEAIYSKLARPLQDLENLRYSDD